MVSSFSHFHSVGLYPVFCFSSISIARTIASNLAAVMVHSFTNTGLLWGLLFAHVFVLCCNLVTCARAQSLATGPCSLEQRAVLLQVFSHAPSVAGACSCTLLPTAVQSPNTDVSESTVVWGFAQHLLETKVPWSFSYHFPLNQF